MARADAATIVAVEVFVEDYVVAEVRIGRELGVILEHRALVVPAFEKLARKTVSEFIGNFGDGHELAGAGRILDFEIFAVVVMELLQALDEEIVHGHPSR